MNIEKLIKEGTGTIVDVRSREEFRGGHVRGSVNIPVQELAGRLAELKALKMPLVLCCVSGGRSGMAQQMLSGYGIECWNVGSWMDVNYVQSKTT